MDGMIDITGFDKVKLVQEAYNLSKPQGMGYLHYSPGNLAQEQVERIAMAPGGISMDYVQGRAVKLHVFERDGRSYIRSEWFDHSAEQLRDLLRAIGLPACADEVSA